MNIYLDAAFFPSLNFVDFQQEGFRLDFKKDKNLTFKGVVYNEMKGVMSEIDKFFFIN
jgi:presequence protease